MKNKVAEKINVIMSEAISEASNLAMKEIERIARAHLVRCNTLHEFVMCMGRHFFTDKAGNVMHCDEMNLKLCDCPELHEFINSIDNELKITGVPIRFTATGLARHDW